MATTTGKMKQSRTVMITHVEYDGVRLDFDTPLAVFETPGTPRDGGYLAEALALNIEVVGNSTEDAMDTLRFAIINEWNRIQNGRPNPGARERFARLGVRRADEGSHR